MFIYEKIMMLYYIVPFIFSNLNYLQDENFHSPELILNW